MGTSNYYADGQWNFICDLCGKKEKSGNGVRTWDNFYVCRHHKEERNPQDFLHGVKDNQTVPWSRPVPPLQFASSDFLVQEDGSFLLQETGSWRIYLIEPVDPNLP